jgi:type I restriction enzyme, S subunit
VRWPQVQLRHVARFAYGESLAAEDRCNGDIRVFGSNGAVGLHDRPNTLGPVLVVGRKGSYGKIQFSPEPVFAIDTTYYVDGSTTAHDIRWLYYSLSTLSLDSLSQDVGVPGLSRESAYVQRVGLPSRAEQRAIADYLDTETARIDALIAKKQRMIELLRERCRAVIDGGVGPFKRTVQLRRLVCDLTSGPRGWAELVGETGAPFLRITNISRNSIDLDMHEVLRVDPPSTPESRRARTKAGDVLVSITADIGSVGVVSNELAGSFFSQHVARVTPIACDSTWLAYAIKSTEARAQLDAGQYGGTKTQLSLGDVAGLRVPDVGLAEQRATAVRIQAAISRLQSAEQTLVSQIGLLREHRQALITAAVTGELEVPGVAA